MWRNVAAFWRVGLLADDTIIYGIDSGLRGRDAAEATSGINETLVGIAGRGDEVGLGKYPL